MPHSASGTRRWQRYSVELRLRISVVQNGKTSSVFGRSSNLSEGGMGAFIPCEIPPGSSVFVAFIPPGFAGEISLAARVCNAEGFRYGLEFEKVPQEIRGRIVLGCKSPPSPA